MGKQTLWLGMALAGLVGPAPMMSAQAHHSFPATYNVNGKVTIEGTVSAFLFRNPHSFVHVTVKEKSGKETAWGVEWGGGAALTGQGVGKDTIKRGDVVIIKGAPARDSSSHRLLMRELVRPKDGFKWAGSFN